MAENVVADGIDPGRVGRDGGGWWLVTVGAVAILFFVFAAERPRVVPPDTSLPRLEIDGWAVLRLPGSGGLAAVTEFSDALLTAGDGPQFWRSSDGAEWELAEVVDAAGGTRFVGGDTVTGLAATDQAAVAVGVGTGGGNETAAVWVSIDGATWRQEEIAVPIDSSGLDGVVADGDTLVAWGWVGTRRDFDPAVEDLLLVSDDGRTWRDVSIPAQGVRVHAVAADTHGWLAMGGVDGRPTIWSSTDLGTWEAIPSDGLPFGWTMVGAARRPDGLLAVNLAHTGNERTQMWVLGAGQEWRPASDPVDHGPRQLIRSDGGLVGVGAGRLWRFGEEWTAEDIDGRILGVRNGLAVGALDGQPALWWKDGTAGTVATVEQVATGGGWSVVADLGQGILGGVWPVAGGSLVSVGHMAWFIDRTGSVSPIDDLVGVAVERVDRIGTEKSVEQVVPAGDARSPTRHPGSPEQGFLCCSTPSEWVIVPGMLWSSDGSNWDLRHGPWDGFIRGGAGVEAVTDIEGGSIIAIGRTDRGLWASSRSDDHGRTWKMVSDPFPATPVYGILPLADGFIGEAARPRTTREAVTSIDGISWDSYGEGDLVEDVDVPAIVTSDGELVLLVDGTEMTLPHFDITALAQDPVEGEVALVAGGRLWLAADPWEEIPLDPRHGLGATDIHPVVGLDAPTVVGYQFGRVHLYQWTSAE